MKFIIDEKIFDKFPDTVVGVIVAKNLDNIKSSDDIQPLIQVEEKRIRANFDGETLSQDENIACWRKAYSDFGVKPKEAKSSVESLYKIVLRGNDLRQINMLVDIYNYICLKHMMPVGGEDIDKMVGDLQLTFAENEKPVKLLGDEEAEAPKDGEVIYKDDEETICRCWNWREADRTKLTESTKNAVLVIESVLGDRPIVQKAVEELSELIKTHCSAETRNEILDKDKTEIEI